ncbi:MAG: CoA pyrophosphatase [Deferribacterota bacterium]|nr:CoA pyrophosphatase [Deferribacterota bacterium]
MANRENTAETSNRAAVLVIFIKKEIPLLVLTKRSNNLLDHSGEISFPGGSYEEGDRDILDTAFRETFEEIGLERQYIKICCRLKDEISFKGKIVTPFIGIVQEGINKDHFNVSEDEVEKLLCVPIYIFQNNKYFWSEKWIRRERPIGMYFYKYSPYVIWGMTGRIIYKLFNKEFKKIRGYIC